MRSLVLLALVAGALHAQTTCAPTPTYSICDISFDLPPDAPKNVELNAEFRGPSHRTFLLRAFRSGPNRLIVRFSPFEAGAWEVRVSSTVGAFHDKELQFTATASSSPGWIETANLHHFRYTGGERAAHLWLGDTAPEAFDLGAFEQWVSQRAAAGVNHLRVAVPNKIDEPAFDNLDARIAFINGKGITTDLVLTPPSAADRESRQSYFRYVISRCAARNATWVLLDQFEAVDHAHAVLREMAGYLDEDPFHHLRTVGAAVTSATFAEEKWLNVRSYGSPDWMISDVEDQVYSDPAVSLIRAQTPDDFRRQLWNASMSGSYIEAAATDANMLKTLSVWKVLMADTRFWDEEPFFEVEGARGLSLPNTEFILYLEKPGPVTVQLENKHKWSGEWINPISGERTDLGNIKSDLFNGEPPDLAHDWVLHIYREGHKESLKSFRFEARTVVLQEVEVDLKKVPFEIAQPVADTLPLRQAVPYAIRLRKETRASRRMIYLWTGEVSADDEGYRVLGTGAQGTWRIPANIVRNFPATLHVRLYGLNALGKLYSIDQNYAVTR